MKLAIDIVQSLLLPKLYKDTSFEANQANIAFWETFTTAFLNFEKDAKPVYAAIYRLGLKDAERIISKLDTLYISLIKELAEKHVLGISSEAIDYLITSKNSAFKKQVQFFIDVQNAINKVERKRIKTELPNTFDKLSFQLSDDAIAMAITKKEREVLKEKMSEWDKGLALSEETPVYTIAAKKVTKNISLTWIKYAAAACVVLGLGFWFYTNQNQVTLPQNNVVNAPVKKDTTSKGAIAPDFPSEALVEVSTVTRNATVIESGLGFALKEKKIKIIENNQRARKLSIVKAIEEYQKFFETEIIAHRSVVLGPRAEAIKDTIFSLQKELALLNENEKQYTFNGKELVLFVSVNTKENAIVLYEDTFYLKRNTDFFKLTVAKQPQPYVREINSEILKALDKIYNGY